MISEIKLQDAVRAGKAFLIIQILYQFSMLADSAEKTRKWYHSNWCHDAMTANQPCGYWVGSIWDYIFMTASSFHTGLNLRHVIIVGCIVAWFALENFYIAYTLNEVKLLLGESRK